MKMEYFCVFKSTLCKQCNSRLETLFPCSSFSPIIITRLDLEQVHGKLLSFTLNTHAKTLQLATNVKAPCSMQRPPPPHPFSFFGGPGRNIVFFFHQPVLRDTYPPIIIITLNHPQHNISRLAIILQHVVIQIICISIQRLNI